MAGVKIQTAQTDNAITLAQLKAYLKVDGSDDDTVLGIIKQTVDSWAKEYTGRTLCTTTYDLFIDDLADQNVPIQEGIYDGVDMNVARNYIILPFSPVASISHVKYYDDDDNATTWATSNYRLDNASVPSRFCLQRNVSYPTGLRPTNGFEIRYVAGYGGESAVPQQIKQACLLYGSYIFEHTGDTITDIKAPYSATELLQPYRIKQLSKNPYKTNRRFGVLG